MFTLRLQTLESSRNFLKNKVRTVYVIEILKLAYTKMKTV